jgi:ferric-dicitrate binding protein FerR (iron transport regulator)
MEEVKKKRLLKYLESYHQKQDIRYIIELFSELQSDDELDEFVEADWYEWIERTEIPEHDLNGVLSTLHKRIEATKPTKQMGVGRSIYVHYSRIASIIMIPLLAISLYFWSQNQEEVQDEATVVEVFAPSKGRLKYQLPDSSIVWLNAGARLKFADGLQHGREVELSGEGYFEVTHQPTLPFSVVFTNGTVEVLGTRFSVNSRQTGDFEVLLASGKVRALVGPDQTPVLMQPNQQLSVKDGTYQLTKVNAAPRIAWVDGKLVFKDDPLTQVFERLSQWYQVDIKIEGDKIKDYTYRGTFQDEDLDDVLQLMSYTLPMRYRIIPREMQEDGSFAKQTITITMR